MKKSLILFLSSALLLSGCSSNINQSPYDYYSDRKDEALNVYEKKSNEFHLNEFYPSDYGLIETPVEQEDGSFFVNYSKQVNYEYTNLYTTVKGRFADFYYINIVAKGTPGKGLAFRLYYGEGETEKDNALGDDVSFSLSEEFATHTLKVKGVYQTRLDMLRKVCIFPEIGIAGTDGSFYFKDVYFSKEIPEGSTLENPGVDTGDTSVTVNGWKTEGWTQYTLYNTSGNTGVSYSKAADWAFIQRDIEIDLSKDNNALKFSFENLFASNQPSVTVIHFSLRGDVSAHIDQNVEYEYDLYYEGAIYTYDLTKDDEVQPDENGLTTLVMPLNDAIARIGLHHENGYRLVLNIESNPNDTAKYRRYRGGEMIIHEASIIQEEIEIDPYSQFGEATYTIVEATGVERNITYTNVPGDKYWPRVCRAVNMSHNQTVTITFRNNGEASVLIGVHAGIMNDDVRSDNEKNNLFYPLWAANKGKKNDDGYFVDGQDITIEPGATYELSIKVDDDEMYKNDSIDVIQLLIDNCYGDTTKRSGNIDIVSVVIE